MGHIGFPTSFIEIFAADGAVEVGVAAEIDADARRRSALFSCTFRLNNGESIRSIVGIFGDVCDTKIKSSSSSIMTTELSWRFR